MDHFDRLWEKVAQPQSGMRSRFLAHSASDAGPPAVQPDPTNPTSKPAMTTIVLTNEAHDAIRAMADPTLVFRESGTRLVNGDWSVPFGVDVVARLRKLKFPNETFSDTILRTLKLSPDGEVVIQETDPQILEMSDKIVDVMDPMPPKQRHRILRKVRNKLGMNADFSPKASQAEIDQRKHDIIAELESWIVGTGESIRLERLGESKFHDCVGQWQTNDVIAPVVGGRVPPSFASLLGEDHQVFVVQHDWAAAFKNAVGIDDGDVPLPYDDVTFEFRVNGRRVIAALKKEEAANGGEETHALLLIQSRAHWLLAAVYAVEPDMKWGKALSKTAPAKYDPTIGDAFIGRDSAGRKITDPFGPLVAFLSQQIRCICIGLAAEVTKTEVVRAPYRLNAAREKRGQVTVFDHHVVVLANRKSIVARLPSELDPERDITRKRLHFVRRHPRRYKNHLTIIDWHLRGDLDLGFIDKEYSL